MTHVVGGAPLDVRTAPWTVLVLHRAGEVGTLCSGSIVDALHVLTAAHCVTEDGATVPAVVAHRPRRGDERRVAPRPRTSRRTASWQSLRVHRGYVARRPSGGDDVAVLALATPLDLNGTTARRSRSLRRGCGSRSAIAVTLAGFGLKVAAARSTAR